jgi:hypothetical protein
VLLIEADHPGWIQILQTRQNELLTVAKRRFPDLDIRGIAFRLSRSRQEKAENGGVLEAKEELIQNNSGAGESYTAALNSENSNSQNADPWDHIDDAEFKQTLLNLKEHIVLKEQLSRKNF